MLSEPGVVGEESVSARPEVFNNFVVGHWVSPLGENGDGGEAGMVKTASVKAGGASANAGNAW